MASRSTQPSRLGPYVIERELGRGGMAVVYEAVHTELGRRVAIKVVSEGISESPSALARFRREAKLLAKLRHPHIVAATDLDTWEGRAYFVMELLEGPTLAAHLRGGAGFLPLAEVVELFLPITAAVAAAHAEGVVHRDLKPSNVLLARRGYRFHPMVVDFGISRAGGEEDQALTDTGAVMGTVAYLSPEQTRGAEYATPLSDEYAIGVMLYECATGMVPFRKGSAYETMHAIATEDLPPPGRLRRDLPAAFDALITRAMERDPARRFPTVTDLGRALMALGDDRIKALWGDELQEATLAPDREPTALGNEPINEALTEEPVARSGSSDRRRSARAPGAVRVTPGVSWPLRPRYVVFGVGAVLALVAVVGDRRFEKRTGTASPSAAQSTSAAAPAPAECTSSAACSERLGAPSLCAMGHCVALASQDCHVAADPSALASDDTLWIGSLYPETGDSAEIGLPSERATELARQDFAQAAALGAGGDRVRPIGLVACDDGADGARAAKHLVEELGVPAIVGFRGGDELIALSNSILGVHHTLAVATLTSNPLITQIPHAAGEPPLVWRTTYSFAEGAPAMSALVKDVIEPGLRAEGATTTRIALLRLASPGHLTFSEDLFDALHFNGKSALDNGNAYREFVFDLATATPETYATTVARLREFAPNVVLYYAAPQIVERVLGPLEKTWPASTSVRPRYVSGFVFGDQQAAMVGSDRDLRKRMFAFTLPSTTPVNGRFTLHYNGAYGTSVSRADAPSTAYDGFYVVAYASLALGAAVATGPDLARAIARLLPPGAPVEVGPSGIYQAFTHLRAGENIDLSGAAGPLDFDPKTGEHRADLSVLCLDVDKHGRATSSLESGMVYAASTGALTGTLHCP